MGHFTFNEGQAIGIVAKSVYDAEREARLKPDELAENSKYKLRMMTHRPHRSPAKFALDILCGIRQINETTTPNAKELSMDLYDRDAKVITPESGISVDVGLNGLLLVINSRRKIIPNSENGYLLSALDDWDFGLASLSQNVDAQRDLVPLEHSPMLV